MRAGVVCVAPGLTGIPKVISSFAVKKSSAERARAKRQSSVVSDAIVIAFASSASWNSLRKVYFVFVEDVLMRGISSGFASNWAVIASNALILDMVVEWIYIVLSY